MKTLIQTPTGDKEQHVGDLLFKFKLKPAEGITIQEIQEMRKSNDNTRQNSKCKQVQMRQNYKEQNRRQGNKTGQLTAGE